MNRLFFLNVEIQSMVKLHTQSQCHFRGPCSSVHLELAKTSFTTGLESFGMLILKFAFVNQTG